MFVYFIRADSDDHSPIKIGVAVNVGRRLQELQIGNHEKLYIMASIKALGEEHAYWIEKSLHKFFKSDWIRGEWFRKINMKKAEKICDTRPKHFPKNKGR
ncbi:MAG: GIY-YIG nuclease family protein [Betaproteobacteria bacterium]|nr:GIY-YIG nuclease family protein [Betaproteobacteria bacterium]